MSGIYKPLLVTLGMASAILCTWIAHRLLKNETHESIQIQKLKIVKAAKYIAWLIVEVAKADWEITKVILDPKQVNQKLMRIKTTQKYAVNKTLFANSITMTPGTITVETEGDTFVVHALTEKAADVDALKKMDKKVTELEK